MDTPQPPSQSNTSMLESKITIEDRLVNIVTNELLLFHSHTVGKRKSKSSYSSAASTAAAAATATKHNDAAAAVSGVGDYDVRIRDTLQRYEEKRLNYDMLETDAVRRSQSSLMTPKQFQDMVDDALFNIDPELVCRVFDAAARCCCACPPRKDLVECDRYFDDFLVPKIDEGGDKKGNEGQRRWFASNFGETTVEEHGRLVEALWEVSQSKAFVYDQVRQMDTERFKKQAMTGCGLTGEDSNSGTKYASGSGKGGSSSSQQQQQQQLVSSATTVVAPPLKAKLTGDKRINFLRMVILRTTARVCDELLFPNKQKLSDNNQNEMYPYVNSRLDMERVNEQAEVMTKRIIGSVKRWRRSKKARRIIQRDHVKKILLGNYVLQNPFMNSGSDSPRSTIQYMYKKKRCHSPSKQNDPLVESIADVLSLGNNLIYYDTNPASWNKRHRCLVATLDKMRGMKLLLTSSSDLSDWEKSLEYEAVEYFSLAEADSKYFASKLRSIVNLDAVVVVSWKRITQLSTYEAISSLGNFELVLCDHGIDLMGVHSSDANSRLGKFYENMFLESLMSENDGSDGLVCSQKIMTGRRISTEKHNLPAATIMNFFCGELMECVKEEWDRCKIASDSKGNLWIHKCFEDGIVSPSPSYSGTLNKQTEIMSSTSFTSSRFKSAVQWISDELVEDFKFLSDDSEDGPLPSAQLICCEIMPTLNYCGQMCGRKFSSEIALRTHKNAMHAPRGTWLCRSCGGDCITSQARTQHERYCGEYHTEKIAGREGSKQHGPGVGKRGNSSSKTKIKTEPTDLLSGGTSSVVPALSVINIKDLPPHIKPLLRDPRQQFRAAAKSSNGKERYIYLYRGVCRQARKGHDRWQSQISFGGVNHYLGTFDSEWDAAAVYAWAHWILYGKEATLKAQYEGEEAAASWEREKKLVEDGKIPVDVQTGIEKKSKKEKSTQDKPRKMAKFTSSPSNISQRGPKRGISTLAITKAPVLTLPHNDGNLSTVIDSVACRLSQLRKRRYSEVSASSDSLTVSSLVSRPFGCSFRVDNAARSWISRFAAVLIGLEPSDFNWSPDSFISRRQISESFRNRLNDEYGMGGKNGRFRSIVLSPECSIGQASTLMNFLSTQSKVEASFMGSAIGNIDCNLDVPPLTCSSSCVKIQHCRNGQFMLTLLNMNDYVSVNGKQVHDETPINLGDSALINIGPRCMLFVRAPCTDDPPPY